MPLQNFQNGVLPTIDAPWLNSVDVLLVNVFNNSTNASQAVIALGFSATGLAIVTAPSQGAARTALGASVVGSNIFTSATQAIAQANIGMSTVGIAVATAADAAAGRTALGATAVGGQVFTAVDAAAARAALGITTAPYDWLVACSDETSNIVTGTNVLRFRVRRNVNLTGVFASLNDASSSGDVEVDVNLNGVSIFTTVISVDQGDTDSIDSATQPVLVTNPTVLSPGDVISIDIDAAGTGAKGLKVEFAGSIV